MTLKEFREQTKDLDENIELWFNLSLISGSAHFRIGRLKYYDDEEKLKDKLYLVVES